MIQSVRGTKDLLPDEAVYWQFLEEKFKNTSSKYGYKEIRTPIFEKTEVFSRSIGDDTDIVNKEMYTFTDKGGELITLRPEGTAGMARAVIQNSLIQQSSLVKLWYFGSFFRYERPQKGRLREFHQYGAECLGSDNPESDTEIILLANDIFKSIGINNYSLLINTLGTDNTRQIYRNELIKFLNSIKDKLSNDSKQRLEKNPLRVLDSKEQIDIELTHNAPSILNYLDKESLEHFESLKSLLDASSISYEISPRLVRGLDYYSHTVFEFQSNTIGAQDAIGGGGRYNGLFEQLGGKQTPAIGFALGVERLLLILENQNSMPNVKSNTDVFIVTTDFTLFSVTQDIAQKLRNEGYNVLVDLNRRSTKAQFRESNKVNARYTIVIGQDENIRGNVTVKNMESGDQYEWKITHIQEFEKK